jgi:hypothetical protein
MWMPWLGHQVLVLSLLLSLKESGVVGTVRSDRLSNAQTASLRHRLLPIICTQCVDCGLDTFAADEWFMVRNEVWEQVWEGRRAPWYRKVPGAEIRQPGAPEVSGDSLHQGDPL